MSWNLFQENSPVLAKLSFEKLNKKIAYLAMIKNDGAPRIHPVTPFIGNGMLFMFIFTIVVGSLYFLLILHMDKRST